MTLSKEFLLSALPSCLLYTQKLIKKFFVTTRTFEKVESFENVLDSQKEFEISIDSRTLKENSLFLALKGPKFDGHDFLSVALENGACGLIIEEAYKEKLETISKALLKDKPILIVKNSFEALVSLAKGWRQTFDTPIVGITGSVGKTTTKAVLEKILEVAEIPAFISYKNQNNNLGLPLNILNMKREHKVGVFELGINAPGEMDELVDILMPTTAVVTALAHAHCGGLGSIDKIAKEKLQIFKHFTDKNIGAVWGDHSLLSDASYQHPVIKFGLKRKNQIQANKKMVFSKNENQETVGLVAALKIYQESYSVNLNIVNEAIITNVLAAISLANILQIPNEKIIEGVEKFEPVSGRFEKRKLKNNKGSLIHDCYNASPESMRTSLLAFEKIDNVGPKIAVIGDMLELGEKEVFWHRQIGRTLCKMETLDNVILVGKNAKTIASTAPLTVKIDCVSDWKEAHNSLIDLIDSDSLILFKASNSVGLSNIVKEIS